MIRRAWPQTSDCPRSPRSAGFTLLELLVVLVIMGLMTALFLVRNGEHHDVLALRTTTDNVAASLREARTQAIDTDRIVEVAFDPARQTWRGIAGTLHLLPPDIEMSAPKIGPHDSPLRSVKIRFDPDGSSTGGEIRFTGNGRSVEIDVAWLTGQVTVHHAS